MTIPYNKEQEKVGEELLPTMWFSKNHKEDASSSLYLIALDLDYF